MPHFETNTNYAPLAEENAVTRYWVEEELSYRARTWGHARKQSERRLRAWAARFPWIAPMLERAGL